MDSNEIEPHILVRYLSNECTDTEKASVDKWINAIPQNRRKFMEYKRIWESSSRRFQSEYSVFDVETDWKRLNEKMTQEAVHLDNEGNSRFADYQAFSTSKSSFFMRAAAIFLVVAVIGVIAYENWVPANQAPKPSLREITTAMAQRVNLTLSDGTQVLLNAGSTIRLPRAFEAHKREVFLEGQAYFQVAKDPDRPFIIHSGNTKTQVLGTKFSIRAYPLDKQITVAVKEGRVSFQANDVEKHSTILHKHQLAEYNLKDQQLKMEDVTDLKLYLGWVDGYLEFKDTPMTEVAKELERRYGVTVSFRNNGIKKLFLTAQLKSRSIKNVLDAISLSLKINYRIEGDTVLLING